MISQKLNDALIDQITMELAAHTQYLAMAIYFEKRSLDKLAAFFYRQAEEEKNHALKIVHFLGEIDAQVAFQAIPEPKQDFESALECAELFVNQEQAVTDSFHNMWNIAQEEGDRAAYTMLQWFIDEQVEEMATSTKMLDMIEMADGNLLMVEMLADSLEAAQASGPDAAGSGE